ncbi:hypothetical protein CYMTET_14859, partial [Cymbomonas tetramitiformis]
NSSGWWAWKLVKVKSNIGSVKDPSYKANPAVYNERPECSAHPDVGYAYAGRKVDGWITFKLPNLQHGDIQVCNYDRRKGYLEMYKSAKPEFVVNGRILSPENSTSPSQIVPNHPQAVKRERNGKLVTTTCMQVAAEMPERDNIYFSVRVTGDGEFHIGSIIAY